MATTATKERPILFSGEMVKAILAGTKTQTRRVVKPQSMFDGREEIISRFPQQEGCPYGKPGDQLWVRETWRPCGVRCGCYEQPCDCCLYDVVYAADGAKRRFDEWSIGSDWEFPKAADTGNVPSIHMPRWASRLTLEIENIRVERLQEISNDDAIAEGLVSRESQYGLGVYGLPSLDLNACRFSPVDAYQNIWQSINGPGSWDANPWVWVVEFRRCEIVPPGEQQRKDA